MEAESAPIQRPRRIRACQQCRSAKVRCSGDRPCERCARRRDKCTFPADEAHVSVPERYLRELQRQAAQNRATTASTPPGGSLSVSVSDSDASVLTPTSLPLPRARARARRDTNDPVQAYNPLVARDVAYVRGSDDRRLLFLGHTSTWSFCRRAFTLLEDATGSPDTPRVPLNLDGAAFRLRWQAKGAVDAGDLLRLPPVDHALFLYNTTKFRLGELFSLVDEASFLRVFDQFHQQPLQTAQTNLLWFVEYLLLLAFGKAFTSPPSAQQQQPAGCELAVRALSLLPDVAFLQEERPAMLAIQVLSLVALYLLSVDMRSAAYQYIGQALRLALHDGLHRGLSDDVMDRDLASRCCNTWWTVYVLDQELTASLGCPPAVPLNSITAPLPDTRSASLPAKALTLRTRLSRLASSVSSTIYSLDQGLSSDFVCSITSVLHRLAETSREIDQVTAACKASGAELPHMFYNITLSHHHCIVLATRPLVIWLLIRSIPPGQFDPQELAGPMARLLETSAQSATTTLATLVALLDRDMLDTFLPFPLEYAFSAALLLSILGFILPAYVPDPAWHRAAAAVFDEMVRRGNVVAVLRRAELDHLEALLEPHRQQRQQSEQHLASSHMNMPLFEGEPEAGMRNAFDPFAPSANDMLTLAEQLEHGDFSSTFMFE
ncbi:hypothetical protein ASPZODRAFT_20750 [Penicilliopsis zonata CBS 506.65]|uniref:Zn(2)-C6 fungal-type domain-containing protein n=1 Tax=Penicilliopsis zonata CBS 506.65 TaxID=1073090 RepID=A0A1L9S4R2_9EURO|nr:hypothetical protein ASPZODRAFT_20750 [Penicilliopsis zonata CBS 506.65]OJJ42155.1 hypothetical protein ASPZODRAFT_20750 [Penicilliopsis zonata CBS 506.65]